MGDGQYQIVEHLAIAQVSPDKLEMQIIVKHVNIDLQLTVSALLPPPLADESHFCVFCVFALWKHWVCSPCIRAVSCRRFCGDYLPQTLLISQG